LRTNQSIPPTIGVLSHCRVCGRVGTGESLCAGGCCVPMFHNKGDVIVITDANDGSSAEKPIQFLSGSSPSYPPCLWNMHVADAYVVALGGAPDAAVMLMER